MIVQCTWKSADGRLVDDAVTWSLDETDESADVEDVVKAENCLLLDAPETSKSGYFTVPACQLLLSTQPPNYIQSISILSEARVMEIYGHHGEYIQTIKNELLEVVEDMAVFRGDIKLERPLHVCSIKFACLRSKNEMWLYGVKVNILKEDRLFTPHMKIPMMEVEQRLKEMGLQLSDKAMAFKHLIECCQNSSVVENQDVSSLIDLLRLSNLIKSRSISPHTPAGSLGSESPHFIDEDEKNMNVKQEPTKCHAEESKEIIRNFLKETVSISTSPAPVLRSDNFAQTEENFVDLEERLKTYINQKFEDLDKLMWEKIQKRFQETEAKLMCKLDEIESFVKPHGQSK